MFQFSFLFIFVLSLSNQCFGDVSHIVSQYQPQETTTIPPPPVPYSFHYKAGRFPGQIDRYRSESGDGSGVIHGTYAYIDPKFKIRTVDYTADKNGFHPILKNFEDVQKLPEDSEAVKLEREKHFRLYNKIASAQANPGNADQVLPRETYSVAKARNHHMELFRKIAAEHEAIAAQREAARLAYEATSVPNIVEEPVVYY
ncbi:uncharacterized protein [Chelonus insularis]|uniref:uncharacterized protein n=1 Tax=Chelonus insularis TaxID=460826 RepID=UPI00158E2120|nr:uncharacterized protein LOC118070608 [Chelonus insularis]